MAKKVYVNRAKMSTSTTGTGTITLNSAVAGFQSFEAAGVTNNDEVRYVIEDGDNWEIGTGTYTDGGSNSLTRNVLESSNADQAISLSGSAYVFVASAADDFVQIDGDVMTGDLGLADNVKLAIGSDNDLEITHNGTNTTINERGTGALKFQVSNTDVATVTSSGITTNITGNVTGDLTGNASTASTLQTGRTVTLTGDVSGSTTFDGSSDVSITATVADDSHNHIIGNVDGLQTALDAKLPLSGGTMTGSLILNADPTTALGAATKEYVDTIAAAGIHYHAPVRVEAPSALNATYDNGSSGVGATLTNAGTNAAINIDGVALSLNDRVLVYNQTNAAHNGIYTVTTVGDGSTAWVLTRATDADSYGVSDPDAFGEGDAFFVKEGDTGAGELYVMNTSGAITFGTTAITFTVIAETAVYTAGTGMSLTGTVFSIGQEIGTTSTPTFAGATINGNITVTGTVDGRDIATDGAKLDGIEASADVTDATNVAAAGAVMDGDFSANGLMSRTGAGSYTVITDNSSNWNTAYSWGDHSSAGYLTSHPSITAAASVDNSGGTVIQDVTLDSNGHVTGLVSKTLSASDVGAAASSHTHTSSQITDLEEFVEDQIGANVIAGSNVSVSYNDTTGQTTISATDTNTTYTAGSGLSLTGTTFSHSDTSAQASVNNSGRTYIQDITLDTYGHITGITSATETVVNTDTNYYPTAATFNTADGVLTISGTGMSNVTVDLDGRYSTTDTNTTYTAGSGLDLTGTTFSIESDARGDLFYIGRDTNDYIGVETSQINFVLDGNVDARIENDGDFHADGNVIAYSTTISDPRLKENIEKITNGLDKVMQLNGYTFDYKADGVSSAGVLSTEVKKVLPSAIKKSKLKLKMGDDNETEYDIVQYDQIIGLLIEAVKDLNAQIEELKNGSTD